jgi:hypothetical protein
LIHFSPNLFSVNKKEYFLYLPRHLKGWALNPQNAYPFNAPFGEADGQVAAVISTSSFCALPFSRSRGNEQDVPPNAGLSEWKLKE